MPSFSLTVAHRPVRVGFLVKASSADDFIEAVGVCTSLWGGLHNPILPVSETGENLWIETIVRRFQVDVLASASDSSAFSEVKERFNHLPWPYFVGTGGQPLLSELGEEGPAFSLVDIALPLSHYWVKEWRHVSESPALLPVYPQTDPLAPMYAASFGAFPQSSSPYPSLEEGYRRSTKATPVNLETEVPSEEWGDALWPILATTLGLTHHESYSRLLDSGCVVGEATNIDHLTFFWNLRAAGADVMFVPRSGVDSYLPLIESQLERLLRRPSRWGADSERLFHVWQPHEFGQAPGASRDEVHEAIADVVRGSAKVVIGSLNNHTWLQPTVGNLPPTAEPRAILATFDERYGSPHVSADMSARPFSEAEVSRSREWQFWAWALEPTTTTILPEETTVRLPQLRDLNDWYSRSLTPAEPGSLRVQPRGFDLFKRVHETALDLYPLAIDDLLARLFGRAGMEVKRSFAGEVTQRVLETMGGLRPSMLFKIAGVRKLLAMEKSRRGIKRPHAVQAIRDYDATLRQATFDRFKDYWRDITPQSILAILLERGVFRAGLELSCPKCRLFPYIEADRIGHEVQCPLCGFRFSLAPLVHGREWVFRISGVFEREGSPQGSVPAILAMGELARPNLPTYTIVRPASDVAFDGRTCETDIIGLEISHDGFPSLVIGECKGQGEIDESDIANLREVRARIRASGVECYLLFAVLRAKFTDHEAALLRSLSDDFVAERQLGLAEYQVAPAGSPILFTTQELEADPWSARSAKGPHRHPMSFNDLAENSQANYLGARKPMPLPNIPNEKSVRPDSGDQAQGGSNPRPGRGDQDV